MRICLLGFRFWGVRSPRDGKLHTSRIPDVVAIPELQWQGLQNREAVINLGEAEALPLLVVEVISPRASTTEMLFIKYDFSPPPGAKNRTFQPLYK